MMKIVVGFSRPKSLIFKPFAVAIMVGYWIPYDHVYTKIYLEAYDRTVVYQASSTMVNFMSVPIFESIATIVAEFNVEIPDEKVPELVQFALDNAGKPYGVMECFGLAWVRICSLFGKTVKNPFGDKETTYVCSELAGYILENFVGDQIDTDLNDITPKELFTYLSMVKTS
jgi:hypothetical protein